MSSHFYVNGEEYESASIEMKSFDANGNPPTTIEEVLGYEPKFIVVREEVHVTYNPWKDASKELPREGEWVIVRDKYGKRSVMTVTGDDWTQDMNGGWAGVKSGYITHWMYIPEVNNE